MINLITEGIEHVGQEAYNDGYKDCLTEINTIFDEKMVDTSINTVVDVYNNVFDFVNTNLSKLSEEEVV
jgi:hypothetical protein